MRDHAKELQDAANFIEEHPGGYDIHTSLLREAAAEIERLRAASQFQTVETAPTDRPILVWIDDKNLDGSHVGWRMGRCYPEEDGIPKKLKADGANGNWSIPFWQPWWNTNPIKNDRIDADDVIAAWDAAIAAEREACAKIIDDNAEGSGLQSNNRLLVPRTEGNLAGTAYAAAIRARGKT